MLTFKNIQDQVLTFLDQAGETGLGLDLVKFAIATAHERRLTEDRWSFMLWPNPVTMTFVNGQRNYVLHPAALNLTDFFGVGRALMRETPTRSRFKLEAMEDRNHYEHVSPAPVKQQPVSGILTVTGSARLIYEAAGGDMVTEDVTNAVSSQAAVQVVKVTKLDATALTIVDVSANTILSLAADEYGQSYPQIRLFADPADGTGTYRFYRKPVTLSHDNDIPDIPSPFSRVLVFDALLELATYNDSPPQQYWIVQQQQWDNQLRQQYQEGEGEGSESRQIQERDSYNG